MQRPRLTVCEVGALNDGAGIRPRCPAAHPHSHAPVGHLIVLGEGASRGENRDPTLMGREAAHGQNAGVAHVNVVEIEAGEVVGHIPIV